MSNDVFDHEFERGMKNRRRVLGDEWVDRSVANASSFNADFQSMITRFAWNEIWGRPGLDHKTRRVIVLAITVALGRWEEFDLHVRAALLGDAQSRLTPEELKEVLMQSAIYAGVPAANTAFSHAQKILAEVSEKIGYAIVPSSPAGSCHPGVGKAGRTAGKPAIRYTIREPRNGKPPRHTVLLSHALGCDLSMWDDLANHLAADYRVICYDHRGHGGSDAPPGPYTMEDLVEDAARLVRELDCGKVVWIGLSMGGMVGQEFALRHPELLSGLVVANSTSQYPEEAQAMWQQRIDTVRAQGVAAIADGALQRFFHPGFHAAQPAAIERFRRRLVSTDPGGYIGCCEAVRTINTTDRLEQVRVRSLVIAGELDQGTPVSMSQAMADRLYRSRLVVIPQASHLSVIEQPEEFARTVSVFLAGL